MLQFFNSKVFVAGIAIFLNFSCTPKKHNYNILFISVDDLNDWVGFMDGNHQAITPHMDKLAKNGLVFDNAYCPAPLCSPSRTAIMTGVRPSSSGIYMNSPYFRISPALKEILTIPQYLSTYGDYYTAARGKIFHQPMGKYADSVSWDNFQNISGNIMGDHPRKLKNILVNEIPYSNKKQALLDWGPLDIKFEETSDAKTAKWAANELNKDHNSPFFIACGIFRPHLPWYLPKEFFNKFPLEKIIIPDVASDDLNDIPAKGLEMTNSLDSEGDYQRITTYDKQKEAVQAYLASTNYADQCVGIILDALNNSKYKDNTIVILWGDHGWHLGEKLSYRKSKLWEESTRVPFIVLVPGITSPGSYSKRIVNLIDIYPTLLELCNLPKNNKNEGRSIVPLLSNPDVQWPYPTVTTMGYLNHTVRSEDWRYIQYEDGEEELYDHKNDPLELTNLANIKDFDIIKDELKNWMPVENKRIRMKEIGTKRSGKWKKSGRKKVVTGLY